MLSIFTNKTLAKVRRILAGSAAEVGIHKRIDENREVLALLQQQAPAVLNQNPWIVGWFMFQDDFLNDLASAVKVDDPIFKVHKDFPRPWPVQSKMVENQDWIRHAHPLQQITVQLQGTRHSKREDIISLVEPVLERLKCGELQGEQHDDDFGYRFNVEPTSPGLSFFDEPAASN